MPKARPMALPGLTSITMVLILLMATSSAASAEWPSFRHDAANTGSTTGPVPSTNTPLWMNETGERVTTTATVADGMVFFVTDTETLYARNSTTGVPLWKKVLGAGRPGTSDFMSSPAYHKGIIYVGTIEGLLYALDARTGNVSWTYNASSEIKSSPIVMGERIIFGSFGSGGANCALTALDLKGKLLWKAPVGSYIWVSPASDGERIFVGSCDMNVRAFDVTNGSEAWNYSTGAFITASPAVTGDLVIVGNHNGRVVALDRRTGGFRWEFETQSGLKLETSAAVQGDAVIVGDGGGTVYNVDLGSGKEVWNVSIGSDIVSSPVIAGDRIVICDTDGDLDVRYLSNGTLNWSYPTNQRIVASPSVSDGRIYVGSTNGVLYCFGDPVQDGGNGDGDGDRKAGPNLLLWIDAIILVVVLLGLLAWIYSRKGRKEG